MIELNVEFQEKYKQLDKLCQDLFKSKDGVTQYINEMEKVFYSRFRYSIYDWDIVYKQLKHLRWVRNKLAHEIGAFDENLCKQSDLDWIEDFYDSILNRKDPLAKLRQTLVAEKENRRPPQQKYAPKGQNEPPKSLWRRIKDRIKKWFS